MTLTFFYYYSHVPLLIYNPNKILLLIYDAISPRKTKLSTNQIHRLGIPISQRNIQIQFSRNLRSGERVAKLNKTSIH